MGSRRDREAEKLRARWAGDLRDLRPVVLDRLSRGQDLLDLPLGHIDGRFDLRGISSDKLQRGPMQRSEILTIGAPPEAAQPAGPSEGRVRWVDLDMSLADLQELRWFNVDVDRCRFNHADLRDLRCWGVRVTDSTFVGADLRNSSLGPHQPAEFRRSRWQRLDVTRADLRWSHCEADLETIDFSGAKFTKVGWGWSNLRDLTFAGIVHGLEIGGLPADRPPDWCVEGIDFRLAKLRDVRLRGLDLGVIDVRFPSDDEHWVIPGWSKYLDAVASSASALPPGDLRIAAEIWVESAVRDQGPHQSVGFIATRDVTGLGGDQLLHLMDQARRTKKM